MVAKPKGPFFKILFRREKDNILCSNYNLGWGNAPREEDDCKWVLGQPNELPSHLAIEVGEFGYHFCDKIGDAVIRHPWPLVDEINRRDIRWIVLAEVTPGDSIRHDGNGNYTSHKLTINRILKEWSVRQYRRYDHNAICRAVAKEVKKQCKLNQKPEAV